MELLQDELKGQMVGLHFNANNLPPLNLEAEHVKEEDEDHQKKGLDESQSWGTSSVEAQSQTVSEEDFLPLASALKTLEAFRDWKPHAADRSSFFNVASTPLRVDWSRYQSCCWSAHTEKKGEEVDGQSSSLSPPSFASAPPSSTSPPDSVAAAAAAFTHDANESSKQKERLLVCHDMMGGYLEDALLQGGSRMTGYRIWHWQLIDIFVYFSHHLVTIPPATWTNAAHTNGVRILGTFITEWGKGAECCRAIFATKESSKHYASQLVAIAVHFGFDGWLINIENGIQNGQMANVLEFLRCLTQDMHAAVPMSQIIWYDSVTNEGVLNWQNELTENNRCFLEVTDGLFTNYCWQEQSPARCALAAASRATDVYMGVDVFGRNMYGGGGYHCDVALKAAKDAKVSAALFAPGWVYETKQPWAFEESQDRFWKLIADAWVPSHPCSTMLPFLSTFDQGVGSTVYRQGSIVSTAPWNNLSSQSLEPNFQSVSHSAFVPSEIDSLPVAARITFDTSFNGGASLKLAGNLAKGGKVLLELFKPSISLQSIEPRPLYVSYVLAGRGGADMELVLELRSERPDAADFPEENPHTAAAFIICSHLGFQEGEPVKANASGEIMEEDNMDSKELSRSYQAALDIFCNCEIAVTRVRSCTRFGPSQKVDANGKAGPSSTCSLVSGDVNPLDAHTADVDAKGQSSSFVGGNGERMEMEWEQRTYEISASALKGRTVVSIAVLCTWKEELQTSQGKGGKAVCDRSSSSGMEGKLSLEAQTPSRDEDDAQYCAFLGQLSLMCDTAQRIVVQLLDCKNMLWGSLKLGQETSTDIEVIDILTSRRAISGKGDAEFSGTLVFEPSGNADHVLWYDVYYWGLTSSRRLKDNGVIEQLGDDWKEGIKGQKFYQDNDSDAAMVLDCRPQWLGFAKLQAFRVHKLPVPGAWDAIGFGIEAVDRTGVRHPFKADSQALLIQRRDQKSSSAVA